MATTKPAVVERGKGGVARKVSAQSLAIAERGVSSSHDFRDMMSALMTDVIKGSLSPEVTNAACNAGGKLLKMVELEYKYAMEPERRNQSLLMAGTAAQEVGAAVQ